LPVGAVSDGGVHCLLDLTHVVKNVKISLTLLI